MCKIRMRFHKMETLGYTDRDIRDEKARALKAEGQKGVCKFSTHTREDRVNPKTGEITQVHPILYVVAWGTPKSETVVEAK
jgi:hypothetical protein